MAALRKPASCSTCCCPFHQGGRCGVAHGCRPAMTGSPPRPASFMAAPGGPIPLCQSCYPGPDGASPCSWNTLWVQHPQAQSPEDPHHTVPPPPRHRRPGGRWDDGQQHRPPPVHIWSPHPDEDTAEVIQSALHQPPEILLPRSPSPNARIASGAGYGRRELTVVRRSRGHRGRKGHTLFPCGGPTPLGRSPSPQADFSASPARPRSQSPPHRPHRGPLVDATWGALPWGPSCKPDNPFSRSTWRPQ